MHNRASSGDQVARVIRYKYLFAKCSRIVKYHHKNIILKAYSRQKVGSGGNLERGNQVYSRREIQTHEAVCY